MATTRHQPPRSSGYYTRRTRRLLRLFDRRARRVRAVLAEKLGAEVAAHVEADARERFAALIPHLAYVGRSWQSCFEIEIVGAAQALSLYRALRTTGLGRDVAAPILVATYERFYFAYPRPLRALVRAGTFTPGARWALRAYARRSQRRRYPGDFVFEMVPGDGATFDFGIDFVECALCKFYDSVGETDFPSLHCTIDYPMSAAFGWGLERAQTLTAGDDRCTFRFRKGRATQTPAMD